MTDDRTDRVAAEVRRRQRERLTENPEITREVPVVVGGKVVMMRLGAAMITDDPEDRAEAN